MKFGNLNYFEKTKNFKLPRTEVLKQTRNGLFLKMDHSLPLFYFFCLFYKQLTVNMFNKSCRWMDSNKGPLVSEATTLSTVPQTLPQKWILWLLRKDILLLRSWRPHPFTSHFLGKVGLNLAFSLVPSRCNWKTACLRPPSCWLGIGS